ncbi:MAG: AAA family ATPase [Phenylobacterium sp.]|uniref:AAA family ATPase n=1 Tax=Phenylobacterium sp. TaxID=1871053 RepID=UPI0025D1B625|nr:ATP-binding protein [Phenylobacterium sp.]MBI1199671.1 AAA family ATPase [Phenylobacterium sp.]
MRDDFLTLARLALTDKSQDIPLFLNKVARKCRDGDPELSGELGSLVKAATSRSSALRREAGVPVPVDSDSRLHLLRIESPNPDAPTPVFAPEIGHQILSLVRERREIERLTSSGLEPTKSALFVGPPGVGKTMSARWIASQLGLPLLVLDLSAVMSSFLGRTGNNVRAVLDYAKRQSCVLLLDEFDSIAKRRDDATEVGELKRLVTVLLQEIDDWPPSGMLIAATNHSELLDPAVWRRFDLVVRFPSPAREDVARAIRRLLGDDEGVGAEWIDVLSIVLGDASYSDIAKRIVHLRRAAVLDELRLDDEIQKFVRQRVAELPRSEKLELAERLSAVSSISQRAASEITGVSRDTIRKRSAKSAGGPHG